METIGTRIREFRRLREWSQAKLGQELQAAAGRDKPWSGEAVRRWEAGTDTPKKDAREALAALSGKAEQYWVFGDGRKQVDQDEPDGLNPKAIRALVETIARSLQTAQANLDALTAICAKPADNNAVRRALNPPKAPKKKSA